MFYCKNSPVLFEKVLKFLCFHFVLSHQSEGNKEPLCVERNWVGSNKRSINPINTNEARPGHFPLWAPREMKETSSHLTV